MTRVPLSEWLAGTEPAPRSLADRVLRLTSEHGGGDLAPADALLAASERSLRSLLPNGCLDRCDALELLAADALVTYAFVAAAADPATLEERATNAMRVLSSVAEGA